MYLQYVATVIAPEAEIYKIANGIFSSINSIIILILFYNQKIRKRSRFFEFMML